MSALRRRIVLAAAAAMAAPLVPRAQSGTRRVPFEQPTHAGVILNRRVAAAIGVTFPPELLIRATEFID